MRVAVALAGLLLVAHLASAQSPERERERASLSNIGPVTILIQDVSDNVELPTGLTEGAIQTALELRLRRNAIPIGDALRPALLSVRVTVLEVPAIGYVYCVDFQLKQFVRIEANNQIGRVSTWERSFVGAARPSYLRVEVIEAIEESADEFSLDYVTVNPR